MPIQNMNIDGLGPRTIFSSAKGKSLYGETYESWVSESFLVRPGNIGLIELIAKEDYFAQMRFHALRVPLGLKDECYNSDCFPTVYKVYSRWKCQQGLGNENGNGGTSTFYTSYHSNRVYWGLNPFTGDIVEFEYIDRPGLYIMQCDLCLNDVLQDCNYPTSIEFSEIPSTMVQSDLMLPCNDGLAQYDYDTPADPLLTSLDEIKESLATIGTNIASLNTEE